MTHLVLTPPALRIYVRNCDIKWNHCLDGQHKTLSRVMSGSSFITLVSTFGSSSTARKKDSESTQKAVLEGVLKRDYQQNRPALKFITGNTAGENHWGLVRSLSNLLKALIFFFFVALHQLYRINWEMSEKIPSFLQRQWFWDTTRTSKLYECISLPSELLADRWVQLMSKTRSILKWTRKAYSTVPGDKPFYPDGELSIQLWTYLPISSRLAFSYVHFSCTIICLHVCRKHGST